MKRNYNKVEKQLQLNTVVVFAESSFDRDYYRNGVISRFKKVFCFEKELTCFDNLETIDPDAIILKTASEAVLWRFIFALQVFKLRGCLFIASSALDIDRFLAEEGGSFPNVWISSFSTFEQLFKMLAQTDSSCNKAMDEGVSNHDVLLVGRSAPIKYIKSLLPILINSDDPVLISGEPGVGKELLIRQIVAGMEQNSAFLKLNCGELKTLSIRGDIMQCNPIHGAEYCIDLEPYKNSQPIVIYFDRVNRLMDAVQSNVLLFIDEMSKRRYAKKIDAGFMVRFISTTDRDLESLVCQGRFRIDLYHRLNVIPIALPPLRDRKEDIPLLVDYFLINACLRSRKSLISISSEAMDHLQYYHWPKNIGELYGIIQRIAKSGDESAILRNSEIPKMLKKDGSLLLKSLNKEVIPDLLEIKSSLNSMKNLSLKRICDKFASKTEKKLMQKALETTNWNRKKAAALLNISYKSMLNKIKMYEII